MDWFYWLQVFALGLVEGLTELLPISSTGHLIVTANLVNFTKRAGAGMFMVTIQAGSILAVCWYYRQRIFRVLTGLLRRDPLQTRLAVNVIVAFLPAAIIGVMIASAIKQYLFNPITVAVALIAGGVIILAVENYHRNNQIQARITSMEEMTWKDALLVGFAQCLAMIPGTSRSGATIIGSLLLGFSRKTAAEFSFFLSIPTILGATVYEFWNARNQAFVDFLPGMVFGMIISFFAALLVVHWLLRYISNHSFKAFGWYRIFFGIVIFLTAWFGIVSWEGVESF